jgi:hypothetical protein
MLSKGDKVRINYEELTKSYILNIEKSKRNNPYYSENIGRMLMQSELKEMKEFDKKNGETRKITDISYHDNFGKNKIIRYELDNKYVYYESELIKVNKKERK